MTPTELASKVDWEGGVLEALEYGIHADDLDDSDPALKKAWAALDKKYTALRPLLDEVYENLPQPFDIYAGDE